MDYFKGFDVFDQAKLMPKFRFEQNHEHDSARVSMTFRVLVPSISVETHFYLLPVPSI
jgi:hypothetical protein